MRRRKPFQQLRGSDAVLLEVQISDLLRLPMGQLDPVNVLDLLALGELDDQPKAFSEALEQFAKRCSAEVADLPNGEAFSAFTEEILKIDAAMVPATFRGWMTRENDRPEREASELDGMLAGWADTEPTPFSMGETAVRVVKAEGRGKAAPADTKKKKTKKATAKKSTRKAAPRRPAPVVDLEKRDVLSRICMERLNESSDKGLGEMVLVAGARHRAKTHGHINVTPAEVTAALKSLKEAGRVHYSAGRWMAANRW